ncbi:MAG: DUF2807 domain-containing protein [Chitinophagales bacterium]|nr:DUF2807 domain-containing protein [Chitinophagales bacterium]
MKQFFLFLFSAVILASCDITRGSGNIITESRSVGGFTGVSVGGDFDVEVKIGPETKLVVEADDNIMKYIDTRVSGNMLKIRTEDMHNYRDVHMKVYITTPSLTKVYASASARVDVLDLLKSDNRLTFNASSSADIQAEVETPEVEADASSAGTVKLRGRTRTYKAQASSGADIRSYDLLSENTKVSVSSGAKAQVHASVNLDAQASSGGDVGYRGGAAVSKSESSGGSVSKKD